MLQSYGLWKNVNPRLASTGIRTRVYRVEAEISTTEPSMLDRSLSVFSLFDNLWNNSRDLLVDLKSFDFFLLQIELFAAELSLFEEGKSNG